MNKIQSESRMSVWSSMSFVESLTVEYLQKLVQLCRNLDKGKNDQRSQDLQYRLGRHDKILS